MQFLRENGWYLLAVAILCAILSSCGKDNIVLAIDEDQFVEQYDISSFIDPCGKEAKFDEVLIRLADGTVLAHFDGGSKKDFLVVLEFNSDNNYTTTDGTKCKFVVENDGTVTDDSGNEFYLDGSNNLDRDD
jgi:hypothetical protein